MTQDISPAVTLLLDYNAPRFTTSGFSRIHSWVREGCDVEKDIAPTIKRLLKSNKDIGSLKYFEESVYKARDARLDVERARATQVANAPDKAAREAAKARSIAFMVRKLGKRYPTEERWLEEYELQHGKIAP